MIAVGQVVDTSIILRENKNLSTVESAILFGDVVILKGTISDAVGEPIIFPSGFDREFDRVARKAAYLRELAISKILYFNPIIAYNPRILREKESIEVIELRVFLESVEKEVKSTIFDSPLIAILTYDISINRYILVGVEGIDQSERIRSLVGRRLLLNEKWSKEEARLLSDW